MRVSGSNGYRKGMGCVGLFLLPFALIGAYMTWQVAKHFWAWGTAQAWVEVPCWIDRVELKEERGHDSVAYRVEADYRYEFANRNFIGNRVWLGTDADNVSDFHHRVYRELSEHQQQNRPFRCFVDPRDPSMSVLYRELRGEIVLGESMIVLVFGGVGVGGLAGLNLLRRKLGRMDVARKLRPSEPWTWDASIADGKLSPDRKWIFFTVLAYIWNAMSWPAAILFLNEGIRGGPSLVWFVFLFPLIGIGLIWKAFSELRKPYRYGTPVLSIQPWPAYVGDELAGTIEFARGIPKSRELIIELLVTQNGSKKELTRETTRIATSRLHPSSFRFTLPPNLPRSAILNEDLNTPTADWQIKITGSEGSGDFEATYTLAVFVRNHVASDGSHIC